MRGIVNETGTACHLNAALIVLSTLGEFENSNDPVLADFLHQLRTSSSCSDPLDASLLNQHLRQKLRLEANDLGDAVTALSKLIAHVGGTCGERLGSGRVYSTLRGICPNSSLEKEERIKTLKPKKLSNPLTLSVDSHNHLVDLLRSFAAPKSVNYTWEKEKDWKTTRQQTIVALPDIFLLHLERFRMQNRRLVASDQIIEIPERLDLNEFSELQSAGCFEIRSGIVHVEDLDNNDDKDECGENGHYVAIVRQEDLWYLIDDENVNTIESALSYFGGFTDSKRKYRGVLLTYHRIPKL